MSDRSLYQSATDTVCCTSYLGITKHLRSLSSNYISYFVIFANTDGYGTDRVESTVAYRAAGTGRVESIVTDRAAGTDRVESIVTDRAAVQSIVTGRGCRYEGPFSRVRVRIRVFCECHAW